MDDDRNLPQPHKFDFSCLSALLASYILYYIYVRACVIGISASPGLASYVSVEEHRYNRQTAPFRTNCTNQEKLEGWDYA